MKTVKTMKTLYITDLDGTLLGSDMKLSKFTKEVLEKSGRQGVAITFATARSLSSAKVVIEGAQFSEPAIIYNGVFVVYPDTGEKLFRNVFSEYQISSWMHFFLERNMYPLCYAIVDGKERVSWLQGKVNTGIERYIISRNGDKHLYCASSLEELFMGEIYYFTYIGTRAQLVKVADEAIALEEGQVLFQQEIYDKDEYWLEIVPKGVSKANAILKMKEIMGFQRIVVFGDGANDIPMFEVADECYAMDNAVPELKRIATGVIGSNVEDGVAKWLNNVLEENNIETKRSESGELLGH